MNSPLIDLKAKGLIRVVRAKHLPASHLEFAYYLSRSAFDTVKPYLLHSVGFKEERNGKIVLRTRFYNIFVYRR